MKNLNIKLLEDGRLKSLLSEKVYDSENETLDVFIDYSQTDYSTWDKRCDIVVANGQKSIKLSDTFSLGREYLVEGTLQLQPIAFSGDNVVKFPITSIVVSESLNVLENDTTVTLSIAQEMLNDIELFKTGVNGELVAQNIKIDGLVLDTDTRLSEQDRIIADLTSQLDGVPEKVDLLIESKANKVEVDASLELKANKQQESWITPTLLNGHTVGSYWATFAYFKNSLGFVYYEGIIDSTNSTDSLALIFPKGYRPLRGRVYLTNNKNTNCEVKIDGEARITTKTATTYSGVFYAGS